MYQTLHIFVSQNVQNLLTMMIQMNETNNFEITY